MSKIHPTIQKILYMVWPVCWNSVDVTDTSSKQTQWCILDHCCLWPTSNHDGVFHSNGEHTWHMKLGWYPWCMNVALDKILTATRRTVNVHDPSWQRFVLPVVIILMSRIHTLSRSMIWHMKLNYDVTDNPLIKHIMLYPDLCYHRAVRF